MLGSELTETEEIIIRRLLQQKNIDRYEIVLPMSEGRDLPGSTYEYEIESLSGTIVTATTVYGFWLDWVDGHYTLGDEKEGWMEVDMSKMLDPEDILAAQQRLRQKR